MKRPHKKIATNDTTQQGIELATREVAAYYVAVVNKLNKAAAGETSVKVNIAEEDIFGKVYRETHIFFEDGNCFSLREATTSNTGDRYEEVMQEPFSPGMSANQAIAKPPYKPSMFLGPLPVLPKPPNHAGQTIEATIGKTQGKDQKVIVDVDIATVNYDAIEALVRHLTTYNNHMHRQLLAEILIKCLVNLSDEACAWVRSQSKLYLSDLARDIFSALPPQDPTSCILATTMNSYVLGDEEQTNMLIRKEVFMDALKMEYVFTKCGD